jgi:hypothetical protein
MGVAVFEDLSWRGINGKAERVREWRFMEKN